MTTYEAEIVMATVDGASDFCLMGARPCRRFARVHFCRVGGRWRGQFTAQNDSYFAVEHRSLWYVVKWLAEMWWLQRWPLFIRRI